MFGWGGAVGEFSISLLVLVYDEGWGPDYSKCGWGERSHFTNYVGGGDYFLFFFLFFPQTRDEGFTFRMWGGPLFELWGLGDGSTFRTLEGPTSRTVCGGRGVSLLEPMGRFEKWLGCGWGSKTLTVQAVEVRKVFGGGGGDSKTLTVQAAAGRLRRH